MNYLPVYISTIFVLTTFLTVGIFYRSAHYSKMSLIIILSWLALQALIGCTGFYTITSTTPPRFMLLAAPPFVFIIALFINSGGRKYIDTLNVKTLTILHIVRIPVELVLFLLSIHKAVPQLMTFEGRNFDILSGLTAPLVYYFGFIKKKIGSKAILLWNFVCLGLLINIVVTAILSAPFPFQVLSFDQPNIAIFYFPFVWLPCCVVPIVLLAHLAAIRQLIRNQLCM